MIILIVFYFARRKLYEYKPFFHSKYRSTYLIDIGSTVSLWICIGIGSFYGADRTTEWYRTTDTNQSDFCCFH